MRKDGGGYGDHDDDPGPTVREMVAIILFIVAAGWILAGAPGWR